MLKIGLTGSIGSGKSTVLKIFKEKKAKVFDSDQIVSQIYQNQKHPAYKEIKKKFSIIGKEKNFRGKLAKIVFTKKSNLKKLEEIIHPVVIKALKEKLSQEKKKGIFVAEVPLLFEKKLENLFDKTVLIKTNKDILKKRLQKRCNLDEESVEKRLSFCLPVEVKEKKADFVLVNNSSLSNLKKEVDLLWRKTSKI